MADPVWRVDLLPMCAVVGSSELVIGMAAEMHRLITRVAQLAQQLRLHMDTLLDSMLHTTRTQERGACGHAGCR